MLGKIAVSLLFLLLVWGNIVAGLKVGLACPDWPLCHGKVLPPFRWDIYMEFMHRVIGAIASVFIILLSYNRFRSYIGFARLIPILTVFVLLFQIILGGVVVLLKLPVDLTTYHFSHRSLAYIIFFAAVLLYGFSFINSELNYKRSKILILILLIILQVIVGISAIHSKLYFLATAFHLAIALFILSIVLYIWFQVMVEKRV